MSVSLLNVLKERDKDLFEKLNEHINDEKLYTYLKKIADTHSPSQASSWTRALVLDRLLEKDGFLARKGIKYIRNFNKTGNAVLLLGENDHKKDIWLLAHLDQITYLIEEDLGDCYSLTPICYHLMVPGERPAVVISYDWERMSYQILDRGKIRSKNENEITYIPTKDIELHPGMRVCFDSTLEWDKLTGEIKGSLDDAAGAVALVFAAQFLADYGIELVLGLTDEEEGKAGVGNQTICRGGARLPRYFDQPELVIASDIHEAAEMYGGGGPDHFRIGDGASFAEKSANGLGAITPPHLYTLMKRLAMELTAEGILLRENKGGYLSRTESVNAIYRTPNIALMGFLGKNRHFQHDVESANIKDLVNLAKSVVCLVLLTQTPLWDELGF